VQKIPAGGVGAFYGFYKRRYKNAKIFFCSSLSKKMSMPKFNQKYFCSGQNSEPERIYQIKHANREIENPWPPLSDRYCFAN